MKFAKKKKINKTEEVFKEALIQAESAYLTKIGKDLPPGQYKCRKWKYIERNKGFGSDVNLEIVLFGNRDQFIFESGFHRTNIK